MMDPLVEFVPHADRFRVDEDDGQEAADADGHERYRTGRLVEWPSRSDFVATPSPSTEIDVTAT